MRRFVVIAVVVICLLAEAGLSSRLAHADGIIRCTRENMNTGACVFEVRGLVGSPGNLGRVLRDLAGTPVLAIPVGILKRNYPVI